MLQDIKTIFSIRQTQSANSFIYYFKRIPFLGKILPDRIYSDTSLKLVLTTIITVAQALFKVISKAIYLGFIVGLPCLFLIDLITPESSKLTAENLPIIQNFALGIFLWVNVIFYPMIEPFTLRYELNKRNCVQLMRMSAKQYVTSMFVYESFETVITFLPSLFIGTVVLQLSWYTPFILLVELICGRMFGDFLHHIFYIKTGKIIYAKWYLILPLAILGIAAAFHYIVTRVSINYANILLWMLPVAVVGILLLKRFFLKTNTYNAMVRASLVRVAAYTVNNKELSKQVLFKNVEIKDSDFDGEIDYSISSVKSSGYNMLNAIFFKRNRRMLAKPILIRLAIIGAIFAGFSIYSFIAPASKLVTTLAPSTISSINIFIFIMYTINIGDRYCKALFYNCDISLLHYSFFRKQKAVMKNFSIRLRKLIFLNLIPAIAISFSCVLFFYITKTPVIFREMAPFILCILLLSVLFSIHHIFLYYVFQPYTTELDVKNPFFKTINGIMYTLCFVCLQIDAPIKSFVFIVLGAIVVYSIVALILVKKFAPKMFRVK